jgi:hypothetical protein
MFWRGAGLRKFFFLRMYWRRRVTMNKSIVINVLAFLFLVSGSSAETFLITDMQDSKSWGDWFTDTEPTDYHPYYYSPYFRYNDQDWGWTHTLVFEQPVQEVVLATLSIEAWDVDLGEIHEIYGDGIYLGTLTPGPNQMETSNGEGYGVEWCTTKLNLDADALAALMDGTMDIWMDIDAANPNGPERFAWGVTLRKSTLTVIYTDSLVDPNILPDEPNIPPDDTPVQLKTYLFSPVDISLPTVNDPGDGISQMGVEQAWFAFDLSSIPDGEEVVSASFLADMIDYDGEPSERTLWYHSDDSWIVTSLPNLSDPGNLPANGPVIGTVIHGNNYWSLITIDIDMSTHDWSSDLIDNYITFMLTGPSNGFNASGAVILLNAELEVITISASGQTNNGKGDALLTFGPEDIVQADDLDIVVPGYSVPSCFDWNNDGLQDLVIGQGGSSGDAKIRVYLNLGTESCPRFSDSFCFYAKSYTSVLTCPASGCLGCFPRVLYWDSDACKDMLVGQADGTVKIFQNLWTDIMPVFDVGTFLTVGEADSKESIHVGGRATPAVVDWNNDGRKDLVVGALDGKIRIFINEGTDTEPDFILESFVQENGANLIVPSGRSSPDVLDMDYDGRKDILTGNTEGQLLFYRNIGTDDAPEFSGYTLIQSDGVVIDLPDSPRSRPFLCYWNVDDYPDVLVGAGDGKVHLYQGALITELY